MKMNYFSITFWFNIFSDHNDILEVLQEEFKDEYSKYNILNYSDNLVAPIISAYNDIEMTNIAFSQINFQYNMDRVTLDNYDKFKDRSLKIYNILSNNGINVCHTAIFINGEIINDNALKDITKKTLSKSFYDEDLVDTTIKIGKKHEDLFYKIVTILNKKQVKLVDKFDSEGRRIPLPLMSWNDAEIEHEIIDVSYEINDKYSFDYTKDYHTTEFYLNKMLYILKENFEDDINNILNKGKFN